MIANELLKFTHEEASSWETLLNPDYCVIKNQEDRSNELISMCVISAKETEFETGFNRGGHTRKHLMYACILSVKQLIVVVTKMDTVDFAEKRFEHIKNCIYEYVRKCGSLAEIHFVPVVALVDKSDGIVDKPVYCSWYIGPSVLECVRLALPPSSF
jgi:translation elongation factor EF-1alpha